MSSRMPGSLDPMWAHDPTTRRRRRSAKAHKVHLRVGKNGPFEGPACGNDLRVESRGLTGNALPLTDEATRVTCQVCRRSYAFQRLPK